MMELTSQTCVRLTGFSANTSHCPLSTQWPGPVVKAFLLLATISLTHCFVIPTATGEETEAQDK